MIKKIQLKVKKEFKDLKGNIYEKNKIYPFSEKDAQYLLDKTYLVEKVGEIEVPEEKKKDEKTK